MASPREVIESLLNRVFALDKRVDAMRAADATGSFEIVLRYRNDAPVAITVEAGSEKDAKAKAIDRMINAKYPGSKPADWVITKLSRAW